MEFSEEILDQMIADNIHLLDNINVMPGDNIKTSAYGLFIIALDQCTNTVQESKINEAIAVLDTIDTELVHNSMGLYYPPDNINYDTTIQLAECFIKLHQIAGDSNIEQINRTTGLLIENTVKDILGLPERLLPIEDIITYNLQGEEP